MSEDRNGISGGVRDIEVEVRSRAVPPGSVRNDGWWQQRTVQNIPDTFEARTDDRVTAGLDHGGADK